jgi:uncharacterized membrane protein
MDTFKFILWGICAVLLGVNLFLIAQLIHRLRSHPNDTLETHQKYLLTRLNAITVNFVLIAAFWLVLTLLF